MPVGIESKSALRAVGREIRPRAGREAPEKIHRRRAHERVDSHGGHRAADAADGVRHDDAIGAGLVRGGGHDGQRGGVGSGNVHGVGLPLLVQRLQT